MTSEAGDDATLMIMNLLMMVVTMIMSLTTPESRLRQTAKRRQKGDRKIPQKRVTRVQHQTGARLIVPVSRFVYSVVGDAL